MNRALRTLAAIAVFCGLIAVGGSALAANTVNLKVVDNGQPVSGVQVEILSSTGATQHVTNGQGIVTSSTDGKYFRVKLNGAIVNGIYLAGQNLVTVEINN